MSNSSIPVNIFLEVDDFGKGLCVWKMMPCVCEPVCQQCLFCTCSHAALALRVRRVWPPQHNKLPVTFIPEHPCCFGAVAEGRAGAWNSGSLLELTWERAPFLPGCFSPLFLQVERQPVRIYLHLIALECEVGRGESNHWAKLLQWLFSAVCFPFGVSFQMENISCATTKQRYCRVTEHCSWKLLWNKYIYEVIKMGFV